MRTSFKERPTQDRVLSAALRPRAPSGTGLLLLALCAFLAWGGCKDQTDPFQCGTPLDGSKDVVQDCSEPGQICVCATRSCAQPVDADLCESTYQYLDKPFVTERALDQVERIAGTGGPAAELRCVPKDLLGEAEKVIHPEDTARRCDGAGAAGGAGTTTTTGAASGAGGTTSGGAGAGGGAGGGTTTTGGGQ